jgi:Xaa-Pro aminopeptidase
VEASQRLGIEHVVDWSEMESFFSARAAQETVLYFADAGFEFDELPPNLLSPKSPTAPIWLQPILQKWPTFEAKDASTRIQTLMEVQNADEIVALRTAAKTTVAALMAGLHAIRPNVSQRSVEAVVESTCWNEGGRGTAFWPWAMAGENAVFPQPFFSMVRYDHLNRTMLSGELVRLDVGCEWAHYTGDLGRTVPVSGHYADDQRETWNIFVAAYLSGAKALREGVTVDQVFEAWRKELVTTGHSRRANWRSTPSIPGRIARTFRSGKCTRRTWSQLIPRDPSRQEPRLILSQLLQSMDKDFSWKTCT